MIKEEKPLFIAEIGVNHEGDLDTAKALILAAKKAGADVAKFQSYKKDLIAAPHSPYYWDLSSEKTESQYELFGKYDSFGIEDYHELAAYCLSHEIEFMTTFFDIETVKELGGLVSRFKVASADITNFQLLREIGLANKPIILSTGAASMLEIANALSFLSKVNNKLEISLLHCVLNYPTDISNAQLGRIAELKVKYPMYTIGYSDHTKPVDSKIALIAAYSLGARIFEKHFTLDKDLPGNDHYHSFDYEDLQEMIKKFENLAKAVRFEEQYFLDSQSLARENARRGLYVKRDMNAGDIVTEEDLIPLRPTVLNGVNAQDFYNIVGKELKNDKLKLSPLLDCDV